MKKASTPCPADFMRARLPEERLTALWSSIEQAEAKLRRRRRAGAAGAALLGAVLVALVLFRAVTAPTPVATDVPDTNEAPREPRQLSLADGSTLSLSGEASARLVTMSPTEVRVRLEQGTIECDVAPDRARRFTVEAGGFEVVVTGTRFTVSLGADGSAGAAVRVERGSVEVREGPVRVLAALGPGQLWASTRTGASDDVEGSRAPAPPPVDPAPLPAAAETPPAARPSASTDRPNPAAPSAATLFERATAARLAGNPREAADAFDELRRRYPADERAGHAAFMSGRLRLDALGDPAGAIKALSFAIAHRANGFYLEDAEARLVEALAKARQLDACREARARFLATYPRSLRRATIEEGCEQ